MFEGFSGCPPTAFVFCGNFLRPATFSAYGDADESIVASGVGNVRPAADLLRKWLGKLAEAIEKHPQLRRESRFVFVPGLADPGISGAFPRLFSIQIRYN
jgi:hypothetical protein